MLINKELLMLAHLRQNCRIPLTKLSKKTGIPVSTLFDKLQEQQKQQIITKTVPLFNFQKMGYSTRATMMLRVNKEDKEKIAEYLVKNENVNNVYKINNGYDFIIECVFRSILEMEQFTEQLESKFTIKSKETHYIVDDLKREGFLSNPEIVCLAKNDSNI